MVALGVKKAVGRGCCRAVSGWLAVMHQRQCWHRQGRRSRNIVARKHYRSPAYRRLAGADGHLPRAHRQREERHNINNRDVKLGALSPSI